MAKMIHHGLFVGGGLDTYKFAGSILHCARDPWYVEANANLTLQERFKNPLTDAKRVNPAVIRVSPHEMALNMVDADSPRYFSDELVNPGLDFITERFAESDPVLVHCNMGISRSPSVAFLWLFEHGFLDDEFRYALPQFKELYPDYSPSNGVWYYLKNRCDRKSINKH